MGRLKRNDKDSKMVKRKEKHKDFKLLLEEEFEIDPLDLAKEFWNPDSKIWQESMKDNEMTNFVNSDVTETSKKSTFVVKMSAPIGPKTADIVMTHDFKTFEDGETVIFVNEIQHETLNFPYADYFDIIHRFEFESKGKGRCILRFYSRSHWNKSIPLLQGAINKYVTYKQGIFVKGVSKIIKTNI